MAHKSYVLDTNVLLHDACSILSFEDNEVILPLAVVEELDKFKKDGGETGRNARQVSRLLDQLRQKGTLTNGGAPLDNGGRLRVIFSGSTDMERLPPELKTPTVDNQILALCLNEISHHRCPVVLVTKDINLRIKAHAVGLTAEDYETDKISYGHLYSGSLQVETDSEQIDRFFRERRLHLPAEELYPNHCVTLKAPHSETRSAIGRFDRETDSVVPLMELSKDGCWGILPRNREQKFALELLLNPAIALVTMIGRAGTGKTLMAIAAGMHAITEKELYGRLLVSRPVFPMGRDLGFLPGDVEEKLAPWMQPIHDNIDLLLNGIGGRDKKKRGYQEFKDLGLLEIEPLTYIRGRSIPRSYMIVDEAQNLTPHEVKTIVTRAGEGTKIVLTGDPEQIDNPYVDASSNGLTYVVERFKTCAIAGHITLIKGERSQLAEYASKLL